MKGLLIIAPLILVVLLGMVLKAVGFLKEPDRERLMNLLYWVALPALLFRTTYLSGARIEEHMNMLVTAYLVMMAVPLVTFLISLPFTHRGDKSRRAVSVMASARGNHVYLGLPVCALALHEAGMEAASVFIAITLPGYNVISILWGEIVYSGGIAWSTFGKTATRVAKNPLVASSLVGLAAAQLGLPVPETLMTSLKLVSDMATGIALILLGMGLEFLGIVPALRRSWHDVLIKLVMHPAMTWAFFAIWHVPEIYLRVAVLIAAMPTAVNTFIIARGMKLDDRYACEIIAVSTILAPITIPIWIALLGIG
jgi:predicted permease